MLRLLCVLILWLAACAEPQPPADTADPREALLDADRAFAAATAERGLDGWMSFFAPDAVRLTLGGEIVQGLFAVKEQDRNIFADTTRRLTWEPTGAGIFDDGDHGFTTGRYAIIQLDGSAPDTLNQGAYISIWRRGDDGVWRVILDTGN